MRLTITDPLFFCMIVNIQCPAVMGVILVSYVPRGRGGGGGGGGRGQAAGFVT